MLPRRDPLNVLSWNASPRCKLAQCMRGQFRDDVAPVHIKREGRRGRTDQCELRRRCYDVAFFRVLRNDHFTELVKRSSCNHGITSFLELTATAASGGTRVSLTPQSLRVQPRLHFSRSSPGLAARADATTPAQRAAATTSHSEQARLLAATLQRLEAEQALRQDIDSRRDRRVRAPEAEHTRKAAPTRTPPDEHERLAERYHAKKASLELAMHVRQELRDRGVRDDKLPSHAEIVALFNDLRAEIRREAAERRYRPTKSEAKLMAEILYERGRSQRRGRGIG